MTPISRSSAPSTLAIIAALPRELAMLSRDLGAVTVTESKGLLLQTGSLKDGFCPIILASAGMGAQRVSLAVAAALAHGPIGTLLSIGFAGACDPLLSPGNIVEASVVIDSRSGERFDTDDIFGGEIASPGVLVTSPRIAGIAEKLRLRASYNASAVDMEAATVARIARAHGIPFGALKSISDEHDVDLTNLSAFANAQGHFRTAAFALHTLLRPHQWRSTAKLGRNSKSALDNLTGAVHQLLAKRVS